MQCNVSLLKLLSAHKSHVRETILFTGAIPNTVRNSQISRFVSVPGQNPGRWSNHKGNEEHKTSNESLLETYNLIESNVKVDKKEDKHKIPVFPERYLQATKPEVK